MRNHLVFKKNNGIYFLSKYVWIIRICMAWWFMYWGRSCAVSKEFTEDSKASSGDRKIIDHWPNFSSWFSAVSKAT